MSRVDEIRKRLDDLRLHGKHGQVTWPAARAIRGFIAAAPEDCSYLLGRVEKLEGLLQEIAEWKLPASGRHWSKDNGGGEMSYEAAYGTNGSRDYWREKARTLLADESKENDQ